jgi:glyoxylase-like metal-dependent hydrolase (beta-lactamase superfamily II)
VDRKLKEGETFSWDGHSFTVFHMPGHTWWALGMFGQVDGMKIAFTGDNLMAGTISPLRAAAPVYRNKMLVDSIALGAERLREYEPELLLTGHTGAIEVNRQILDDFITWARDLSDAFVKVVAVPDEVNFALDPNWCTIYPYQSRVKAGERLLLELRATNHAPKDEYLRASLALPDGWTANPDTGDVMIYAGKDGALTFAVDVPAAATGRHVLCADVTLGERRFGWVTEAIVDIR